jgi:hypothetical protein
MHGYNDENLTGFEHEYVARPRGTKEPKETLPTG